MQGTIVCEPTVSTDWGEEEQKAREAPFANAAQQKGDAIAKPLCEVRHGHADFLSHAARLPRFTVCFGS